MKDTIDFLFEKLSEKKNNSVRYMVMTDKSVFDLENEEAINKERDHYIRLISYIKVYGKEEDSEYVEKKKNEM